MMGVEPMDELAELEEVLSDKRGKGLLRQHFNMQCSTGIKYGYLKKYKEVNAALVEEGHAWARFAPDLYEFFTNVCCEMRDLNNGIEVYDLVQNALKYHQLKQRKFERAHASVPPKKKRPKVEIVKTVQKSKESPAPKS